MTVSSTEALIIYAGNGATTRFGFAWPFFNPADLSVILFNTSTDLAVTPAPVLNGSGTYDYTVTGTQDADTGEYLAGGTIVFNTAPPGGTNIIIARALSLTQPLQLFDNTKFPSKSVEAAFDRAMLALQDLAATQANAVQAPLFDSPAPQMMLPAAALRAGLILGFDGDGNVIVLPPQSIPASATGLQSVANLGVLRNVPVLQWLANGSAFLLCASSLGDGGHGEVFWNPTDTRADNGGTVFLPTGYGGVGRINRVISGEYHAEWWGLDPTGTNDSTANLQAAMNYALPLGAKLTLGPGTFKISAALTIAAWAEFDFLGAGRGLTTISQATNNTPIFKFTTENARDFRISGFHATWATPQSAANTAANVFFVSYATSLNDGVYNFELDHIICDSGFRFFSNDTSQAQAVAWGGDVHHITMFLNPGTNNQGMTGGLVNIKQPVSDGQPNWSVRNCYVRADTIAATETIIAFNVVDNFTIDDIEVNVADLGCAQLDIEGSMGVIGTYKLEGGTFTVGGTALLPFKFVNSDVTVGLLRFYGLTINIPGGKLYVIYNNGSTSSRLHVEILQLAATITAGTIFCAYGAFAYPAYITSFKRIEGLLGTANIYLSDCASMNCLGLSVDDWLIPHLAPDNGDANYTAFIGQDRPIQPFLTTLTANRTLTLGDSANGGNSNLFNGAWFEVVRNNAVPGAFNLLVQNAAGGTIGTLASTNGKMRFAWSRDALAWVLVSYEIWTGAAP